MPTAQIIEKAINDRIQNREHFIAQYLKNTGHPIGEVELVEKNMRDGTVLFWCRLRDEN